MRFGIVIPKEKKVSIEEFTDIKCAFKKYLDVSTDHGIISKDRYGNGIGIFVYEYGLYSTSPEYFSINKHLYRGNAILFAFDYSGETVDLKELPEILFLGSQEEVEKSNRR